jgi:hypothetical protein
LIAYLDARPSYCDRGRWRQGIEVAGFWRSEADPGPRYYFSLEAGKSETIAYLRAKKIEVEGAEWREVHYEEGALVKEEEAPVEEMNPTTLAYLLRDQP